MNCQFVRLYRIESFWTTTTFNSKFLLPGLERHRSAKSADDLLELAARAAFVLRVLSMMGLVSGGDATGRAGEFAMEALEAVQYNTHPIDQVWFNFSSMN